MNHRASRHHDWRVPPAAGRARRHAPSKRQATLGLLSPVVTIPVLALGFSLAFDGLSAPAVMAALLLSWCLPVIAAVLLAQSAARLRERVQ